MNWGMYYLPELHLLAAHVQSLVSVGRAANVKVGLEVEHVVVDVAVHVFIQAETVRRLFRPVEGGENVARGNSPSF